ncbi:cation channel family protein (macronuclear) [Tetrahymena thermophila SB210]|uniref:Cation channel family protein n=1 Tax=Tetrahymena thermophila (strain SB210) TaxID=312017 RepID=Q23AP2_TETTS|nr:cation channel family protein [Tetrahymena thermophila SB210]EAR93650.2 cation channel family protein [Tetrahymena thermophila SB210]|eukprot:XP_001013895.2 cation channel family protein [Tetrahymena thermophila SB210]
MKLKSLDENRAYQKRKTIKKEKSLFDFTPRLAIPEFTIPSIRQNDDDIQISLDCSERHTLDMNGDQTVSDHKLKKSASFMSKNTTKNNISFNNRSDNNILIHQDQEGFMKQQNDQNMDLYSKVDFISEKNIALSIAGGSQRNIPISATKIQKQLANRRQSKFYFSESESRFKIPSQNSREYKVENIENLPRLKSNFSLISNIKGNLNKMQQKVIAIGMLLVFYVKLKTLSGVNQITKQYMLSSKVDNKSHQLKCLTYLNDFSQISDKKQQQLKKENNLISLSTINNQKNESGQQNKKCSFIQFCFGCIPVIHPDSKKLFLFDIINLIFIILNLTYVPIETVIDTPFLQMYGNKWFIFITSSISVYFFSVILSLNMGYYDKGYCIMDRNKILVRYMKLGFWVDILSTFPMFVSGINSKPVYKMCNLFVILKINWIDKFFYKYFEICNLKKKIKKMVFLKFLYILLKILFFVHVFACVFLAFSYHVNATDNWITKYGSDLDSKGWFTKYVYAFYWGITIMTTVGLGDILPSNIYEVCVLSLFMFFSCAAFAYSFNSIGIILDEMNQRSDLFVKEMRIVSRYLQMKKVDHELQIEVRKYIEYRFQFENEISQEEEKIVFKRLPISIQEKLIIQSNMAILRKISFLQNNFSEGLLNKLCLTIESEQWLNQDTIYKQDDVYAESSNSIKFYILESGQVQLLANAGNPDQPLVIKNITDVEDFGSLEFFNDEPRHYTAVTIGTTKLLSISRSKFLQILKQFPEDYEKFKMLCENAKMNKIQFDIKISCYCCQKYNHSLKECPKIHYIANKELSILKNMFSLPQQRKASRRNFKLKINSLYENHIIQERAICYQQYNHDELNKIESPLITQEDILNTETYRNGNGNIHKNQNNQKVLLNIATNDLISRVDFDIQEKNLNKLVRNQSFSTRKSTCLRPTLFKQNTDAINIDQNEDILKQQVESNYSPVSLSQRKHHTTINLNTHDQQLFHKNQKKNTESPSPHISYQKRHISINNLPQDEINEKDISFMIDNFDRLKNYKYYFPYNNYDNILNQYEKIRPKFKYQRLRKPSQYFLFPNLNFKKLTKNTKNKIQSENKIDVTFNDSFNA